MQPEPPAATSRPTRALHPADFVRVRGRSRSNIEDACPRHFRPMSVPRITFSSMLPRQVRQQSSRQDQALVDQQTRRDMPLNTISRVRDLKQTVQEFHQCSLWQYQQLSLVKSEGYQIGSTAIEQALEVPEYSKKKGDLVSIAPQNFSARTESRSARPRHMHCEWPQSQSVVRSQGDQIAALSPQSVPHGDQRVPLSPQSVPQGDQKVPFSPQSVPQGDQIAQCTCPLNH
ncbi:hypothetical protein CEXT_118211 [Caerostris extrusa]|uniref:Uncharacterized protein n=1 Tax=Caerostris extrusa TaxID=172846 RepID=A0AAV4UKB7_CAEEX|nr:hypothetical protein CEXT_118211 [Caerostris extrusa]